MEKLTSMTDFVLKESCNKNRNSIDNLNTIFRYALFLKQPLELWMFVPCDEKGNVLEEPIKYKNWINYDYSGTDIGFEDEKLCCKYQQAKERCLFEGFEVLEYNYLPDDKSIAMAEILHVFWHNKITGWKLSSGIYTVEDLVKYNLQITPTAIKQIGL